MLKLLITAYGEEVDYSTQVDWTSLKISEQINVPVQCTFNLTFSNGALAVPPVRAYVRVYSTQYDRTLFTGFVVSAPVRKYLGRANPQGVPLEAMGQQLLYQYTCSSDEHLLNIKAVPFIPAFVGRTQGQILAAIANILCPGFYDTSGIQDGDLVPFFEYTPTQSWSELAKLFGDGFRFRYRVKDRKIWYVPYGDQPLGISYDETTKSTAGFDARALDTTVLSVPTVNDITIIGDAEAGNNREDYFIGDGFTGNYPLRHKVFKGATSVLLQEAWQNTSLNQQQWYLLDTYDNFDFSAGALNIVTGTNTYPFGTSYLAFQNGIELAGGIDIQNGEVTFNDYCEGFIGGVYTDDTFQSGSLLGGFAISSPSGVITSASGAAGVVIQPQWAGASVGPAVVTKANHTYALQMVITAPRYSRYSRMYRTIEGEQYGGEELDVTGSVTFYIQDFDITAASGFFYTPQITTATIRDVTMPAFATYALANNERLNLTIGNTTIAVMPYGGLHADVGPSGLYQPTGAILPMLPEDGIGGEYPGPVQPWPSSTSGNYVLAPPGKRQGWQVQVLGNGLELQAAQISAGNDADTLAFYAQSLPAAGTPVRLQTWEQQAAVSRLQLQSSIEDEASLVGDDGIRSSIVSDLNPLPRTSEDCDSAAQAFLQDRNRTQYNGSYNCTSYFFRGLSADQQFYPTVGRFLDVNSPARGIVLQKFLVTQLDITVLEGFQEIVGYNIQFGVDLYLEKVLKHFVDIKPTDVLISTDKANPPNPRYTINVDNSFLPDINDMAPALISDTTAEITLLNPEEYPIEVRTVDGNWGKPTVDLIGVFFPPTFTLTRQNFDQVWFMRYSQGGVFSRRSKAIRIRYPQKPSAPTFISATPSTGIGPSGNTVNSFQVQLDYNGDIRSIYGIEIRAADNKTILYQQPATSYALLNIDLAGQTPMPWLPAPYNNDFSLYCYFFNHQWSYSEPLILDAQLLAGTRFPYVWSPGTAAPASGDAMTQRASFSTAPEYQFDANQNAVAYAHILGAPPPNVVSTKIGEPVLLSATPGTGGTMPAGTYLVALFSRDSLSTNYNVTPLSNMLTVTVPANGKIDLTFTIDPLSQGTLAVVANPDYETGWYVTAIAGPGLTTMSISFFAPNTQGAPDSLFYQFKVNFHRIWNGGIIGVQIAPSGVTATTLTLAGANFAANALAGRIVSLLAHYDATAEVELANYAIASNTAGLNTVITVGPNAAGNNPPDLTTIFKDLDIVTIRILPQSITPTSFSDPLFLNDLNNGAQVPVSSLTSVGTTATAYVPNHGWQVSQAIKVTGATQAPYNGQFTIFSVIDADHFTYIMGSATTSPATGTITVCSQGAIIGQTVGRVAYVLEGTGKGLGNKINANTSDSFTFADAWTIDATSVIIIVNASSEPEVLSVPTLYPNDYGAAPMVARVAVENLSGVTWLFRVYTQDINGNFDPAGVVPYREMFFFGQNGGVDNLIIAYQNP